MNGFLKVEHSKRQLVMSREFAKYANDTMSEEYAHLQRVRQDYPHYQTVLRTITRNSNKESYKGLTYEYMEDYILTHGTPEERKKTYDEYNELRLIAECHSKAYRYPTFGMSQGDIVAVDVKNDARPKQIALSEREAREFKTIVLTYPPERRKELCIDKIYQLMNRMDFLSASDLRKYIQRIVDQMSSEELSRMEGSLPAYAAQIRQKIMSLLEEYREKRFFQRIETNEIIVEASYKFPKVISPTVTMFPISKSLYTDEADVNDFEHKVISALAGLSNVRWWHRVIERNPNSFVLNGFINHYPDFIVATEKGNIILVETKGDDRDNSDSKAKLRLGRKWAELAGSKYRYYMVFDENDTGFEGAYRVSEFMELMKRL